MAVYVTIELCQGIVEEAHVFFNKMSATNAEKKWLKENGITDGEHREGQCQNGKEFIVMKCELEP